MSGTIEIGVDTEVSLQIPGGIRTSARLLAVQSQQYLILRGSGLDGLRFTFGDRVILRYVEDGCIYAFETLVLNMVTTPERLLIVSYPRADRVRLHWLRSSRRLKCTLPCSFSSELIGNALGIMLDMSEAGCQLALPRHMLEDLDGADHLNRPVSLQFSALGDRQAIHLAGKVRWQAARQNGVRFGIQFDQPQVQLAQELAELLSAIGQQPSWDQPQLEDSTIQLSEQAR